MSKDSIFKRIHDTLVTDDGEAAPIVKGTNTPTPAPYNMPYGSFGATPSSFPASGFPGAPGIGPVLDEAVYKTVLDKTNFDNTTTAAMIHKYLDAMEGTPLDPTAKFKTALQQAARLEGLTADKVLATFDTLKQLLKAESDRFATSVNNMVTKEVTARQNQLQQIADTIAQKQHEIEQLQMTHTQVAGELADAQTKVSNATTQFGLAAQRRSAEIDQQQAQFSALLK